MDHVAIIPAQELSRCNVRQVEHAAVSVVRISLRKRRRRHIMRRTFGVDAGQITRSTGRQQAIAVLAY